MLYFVTAKASVPAVVSSNPTSNWQILLLSTDNHSSLFQLINSFVVIQRGVSRLIRYAVTTNNAKKLQEASL